MNDIPTDSSADRHSVIRWLLAAVALLLVVGMATTIALALPRMEAARKGQHAVMPDGTRVELLGTAIGEATFTTEQPWQRAARRILPGLLAKSIPPPIASSTQTGDSNDLTIFVKETVPGPKGPETPGWSSFSTYAVEDATGFRFYRGAFGRSGGVDVLTLKAFPRRDAEFAILLLNNHNGVLARFQIENPIRGPFPDWMPAPLPQTLTTGSVSLTLQSLMASNGLTVPEVIGRWGMESRAPAWTNARIRSVTLLDATGNRSDYMPVYTPATTNRASTNWINFSLSPRETAWKVRALVERPKAEEFAPTEKAVLTNVQVPIKDIPGSPPVQASNATGNLTINVVQQGQGTLSNGVIFLKKFYVRLGIRRPQPGDELEFTVRDDHGRELSALDAYNGLPIISPLSVGWGAGEFGNIQLEFVPAPDAKFLNLEFYLNRPLVFDFLVSPKDVQPMQP